MTLEEIRAQRDSLRAEHAMALRKVEIQLKTSQEKVLAQAIELSRLREAPKPSPVELPEKVPVVSELEARRGNLRDEIGKRDEQIKALAGQLAEAEALLEQRAKEIESIGELYDEASLSSSNRQIELVSRESEMGKLSDDMLALRSQRENTDRRVAELEADNKAVRDALKAEARRGAELDRKLEGLVASLSERDSKIEQRENEIARLREQFEKLPDGVDGLAVAAAAVATGERERLEGRLTTLMRENKRLKGELAKSTHAVPVAAEDALLRNQMHELAAEVVALTARLEGPDSPIAKALADEGRNQVSGERSAMTSLADRVRALQKSPPAG